MPNNDPTFAELVTLQVAYRDALETRSTENIKTALDAIWTWVKQAIDAAHVSSARNRKGRHAMSEKPTLIGQMRARIYGLASRDADICACFQPRPHDDGGLAQSCAVCGYYADVHLLRDALNDLEARAASAHVTCMFWTDGGQHCGKCEKCLRGYSTTPASAVPPDRDRRIAQRRSEANTARSEHGPERRSQRERRSSPPPSASVDAQQDEIDEIVDRNFSSSDIRDIPRYGNAACAACGHTSARHAFDHEMSDTSCSLCDCQAFKMRWTRFEPPFASVEGERLLQELSRHLSPDNENVKRGYVIAAIRDLAQVAMSEKGNAETAESSLSALRSALTAVIPLAEFNFEGVMSRSEYDAIVNNAKAALASASSGDAGTGAEVAGSAHQPWTLCPGECLGNYVDPKTGKRYPCEHQARSASPKAGPA